MLLARRVLFLLLLDGLLLAGATFEPLMVYLAVVYLGVVLAMLLADRRITPQANDFELARSNDPRLSLGADNLITVRVTNRSRRRVRVRVRDEPPVEFKTDALILDSSAQSSQPDRDATAPASRRPAPAFIPPHSTTDFRYRVRPPRRGDYRFGDLNMRWDGVLGLIVRQARFAAAAAVKVYPNLLDIRKYELLVRKGQLQEMGLRHTRVLGSGTEFERLREYQLDDEFRRI